MTVRKLIPSLMVCMCVFTSACSFQSSEEYVFPEDEKVTAFETESQDNDNKRKVVVISSDDNKETPYSKGDKIQVGKGGVKKIEEETEQLEGQPYFLKGVWEVSKDGKTNKYYIFNEDDGNGYYYDLETGERKNFSVVRGINEMIFTVDGKEEEGRVDYFLRGSVEIYWKEKPHEHFYLKENVDADTLKIYYDKELMEAVKACYNKRQKDNAFDVRIEGKGDFKAEVEVFDDTLSSKLIYCSCIIDRTNGKGEMTVGDKVYNIDLVAEGYLK